MKGCKNCDRCLGIENGRALCEVNYLNGGTISSKIIEIDEVRSGCSRFRTWEYKPIRGERYESITDYSAC